MFRLAVKRGLIGLPWGIVIALIISITISAAAGDDGFALTTEALNARMGSTLDAAVMQTALCGLLGFLWGALSVIWMVEPWGILKQTLVYFSLGFGGTLAVEYGCGWIDFDWWSLFRFAGIFCTVFLIVWVCLYGRYKENVRHMNEMLRTQKNGSSSQP